MAEILGRDLDNWDDSLATREPFNLSDSSETGAQFMTGADFMRSAKISSEWKLPVAIPAQATQKTGVLGEIAISTGTALSDVLANYVPNLENLAAQSAVELLEGEEKPTTIREKLLKGTEIGGLSSDFARLMGLGMIGVDAIANRKEYEEKVKTYDDAVTLLENRDFPLTKYARRVLSDTTHDVETRRIVRELYNQAQGIDSSKWYNQAGSIIGAMIPTMAIARGAGSTARAFGATRLGAIQTAQNVAKGFIGGQMAGEYAEETAREYLDRTGDKTFENFTAKDASGLSAAAYGAIGAQIEFIGGIEPIMAGALSKVGLRSGLLSAGVKIGAGEAGEEFLQGITEILMRKIDGTTDKTWKEGFKEALNGAAWGLFLGGTMGTTAFYTNRRNLVKGIKTALPNISDTQAQLVADAMIDSVGEASSQDPTLRNDLRKKVAMMYETSEIDNKEGTIDAITDLEYSLIAADSAERGIDIAENPLFKGEVNELGWFREGIPENRRAEIQGYITELTDLKDQLKKLNEAEQKDWDKIDEIESKLDKFNAYVLDKLSDLARDDASAVRRMLNETEQKYVAKEKEKAWNSFEATQEQKELAAGAASYVFDTLSKEGFDVQTVGGQGKKRAHGSSYLVIKRPGATDLKVRIGVTPIGTKHSAVALNLNAEKLSQEEMLNKIRELIKQKFVKSNKATNVNIGFDEEPMPMFQEQFDLADENARLDDIYPAYDGETIEVDGKERTVYNSNGDRIAKSAEALRNFYKWFGDSKVVDSQGRPLVVYHGTNAKFDTFDINKAKPGNYGKGLYFTDIKYKAEFFGNPMSVYIKIENMADIDVFTAYKRITNKIATELGYKLDPQTFQEEYQNDRIWAEARTRANQEIIKKGYDGIKADDEYIVFEPNQIKSVNNRGIYSSDTGNIYRQNRVSGGAPATYRGAYIPQYRFIQRSNRMDASTLSHELAHDWFEVNFARYRSGEATPDFMRAWGALEKALGIAENATVAPRKASEAFARAYEGWIMNKTDWEKLINVDEKDKDAIIKLMQDYQNSLRDIYQDLTNQYFKETWGKLGELKPELKAWFDKVVNIQDLDRLVERGEMTEAQAQEEKLNRAIDTVIENTTDAETKQTLKEARTLNDTKRYEVEGGNKNALQERLSNLAREIDENNMIVKKDKYDTRRDMMKVAESADNFVKTRLDDALAIINGEMAEVEGLFKEDVYTALERLAVENGDLGLLNELKNSEIANRLAKELGQRVAGFRNWKQSSDLDVVSALKSLDNRFNKALENKKAQKQFNSALDLLDESLKNQDKIADKDLESILDELECK